MTIQRVPPPPPIAQNDPVFNRWLHDLTSFIKEGGGIDTGTIPGYDDLVATIALHSTQIADQTIQIAANTSAIATHSSEIAANTANIAANTGQIAANTANIATLFTRSQVFHGTAAPAAGLGVDGDWYSDTTNKHIYTKVGSWLLIV